MQISPCPTIKYRFHYAWPLPEFLSQLNFGLIGKIFTSYRPTQKCSKRIIMPKVLSQENFKAHFEMIF